MQLYGYGTNVFKNIFKDFEAFKTIYQDSPFFYDEQGDYIGPQYTTFKLIYNNYAGSHVAMSDEDFINRFENRLFEHFEKFEFDNKLRKGVRLATDDDWSDDSKVIRNEAMAPNTSGTTDSELVESLDSQTKVNNKTGYAGIVGKKEFYNRSYSISNFLEKFKDLFIRIYDPQTVPVWVSEGDYLIEGGEEI